jgi:hypothetical protein
VPIAEVDVKSRSKQHGEQTIVTAYLLLQLYLVYYLFGGFEDF